MNTNNTLDSHWFILFIYTDWLFGLYSGWLIRIILVAYYNPHTSNITGKHNPLQYPNNRVRFIAHITLCFIWDTDLLFANKGGWITSKQEAKYWHLRMTCPSEAWRIAQKLITPMEQKTNLWLAISEPSSYNCCPLKWMQWNWAYDSKLNARGAPFCKGTKYIIRIDGKKHAKPGQTKDSNESEGHSINWLAGFCPWILSPLLTTSE